MSIVEPRRKKSDDNPCGCSKSQNKLFNALVMIHNTRSSDNNNIENCNDNNINGSFDSWGNPASTPYQNGNTTASFTMAAFNGGGSSPVPEEVFPETKEPDIIDIVQTFQIHLLLVAHPQTLYHHRNLDQPECINSHLEYL